MVATPKPAAKLIATPDAEAPTKPKRPAFADGLIHLSNQSKGGGLMCPADPNHPDRAQRPEKTISGSAAFHREIAQAALGGPAETLQGCPSCLAADVARIKVANAKPFRRIATPRVGEPQPPTESARRR